MQIEDHFDPTGLWTTSDGTVRKLLLPNGRYLVMKAGHTEWHQGDYVVTEDHIEYQCDDGGTGTAVITGGIIYSAKGVALHPEGVEDTDA
jgi:hypothetical protein